jgi:hypothetical protein
MESNVVVSRPPTAEAIAEYLWMTILWREVLAAKSALGNCQEKSVAYSGFAITVVL